MEFSKSVIEQAATAARIRTSSYLTRRADLRSKMTFSFAENANSPSECAFSLYRRGNGWELGVHVADVAEYACEGSPMDLEASRRCARMNDGFSIKEMLPDIIVNNLCNFTNGDDKLAISVILDVDNDGNLESVRFEESVIRTSVKCIYSEIDQLGLAQDTSSVMALRMKYAVLGETLGDMYELAALCCMKRRQRGGLDCTYFRRVYEKNENGDIVSFKRIPEPDSRAMIREIGYFTAEAVGGFMCRHNIPGIFNGRGPVDSTVLNYLASLVGVENNGCSPAALAADIADRAKGEEYYDFVCDALKHGVPCPEFSSGPIDNSLCACDHIVSFFNPASAYTDLLIQRVFKIVAKARGSATNININRFHKIIHEVVDLANSSVAYYDKTTRNYSKQCALRYIKDSGEKTFAGIATSVLNDGSVTVMLECGLRAAIPSEFAKNYTLGKAKKEIFEIVSYGNENELTLVKPL